MIVLNIWDTKEVDKIFEVLAKYEISKNAIEKCLTVIVKGKAKEIGDILELLADVGVSKNGMEKCLSIISEGKLKEIEEILVI